MARRGGSYGEEEEEDDVDREDDEEEESRWGRRRDGRREKSKGRRKRTSGRRRRHERRGRGGHEEGKEMRRHGRWGSTRRRRIQGGWGRAGGGGRTGGGGGDEKEKGGGDMEDIEEVEEEQASPPHRPCRHTLFRQGDDIHGKAAASRTSPRGVSGLRLWGARIETTAERHYPCGGRGDGGGGEGEPALLTPLERAAVATAVSTVTLRCQQERVLGQMKEQLCACRRRTLGQAADDSPDDVATLEAVIELCSTLGCGVIPRATRRWWIKRRIGGTWEDLRQCDNAVDDYFDEKQHSAEEQQRDHQKQHNDEEQQREPAVQVGHELHGGEGSNEHTTAEKARVLSDVQHVTTCMGMRRL
ncbi:hypothetical protein CBR_g30769 [Chara braunii]|uniref:Uncharacterized protein n=1 Tax=Chara braunii TaxID=69332 RepID=A0A388JXB6_CHABU|nr:hypothetical protein CBR_g30769 [Chara braunii]|eukprot:GBG62449.1 hypothetical protein CBR_g30769 [Chara braunii]